MTTFEPVVAVTNYNKGANVDSTMDCLNSIGIQAFTFDPTKDPSYLIKRLKQATHVVFIGHSSDFRTVLKVKMNSSAKLINYWRGSDYWNTRKDFRKRIRVYLSQIMIDSNWAVGEYFAKQIWKIGIKAKVVPSVIFERKESKAEIYKSILAFFPAVTGRAGFSPKEQYGIQLFLDLARKLPDFSFYTVGKGQLDKPSSNLKELGYQRKLSQVWSRVDYYFRVTNTEGLPKMIIEAAEYGVLSITKHKFFEGLMIYTDSCEIADKISSYENYEQNMEILTKSITKRHSFQAVKKAYLDALDG